MKTITLRFILQTSAFILFFLAVSPLAAADDAVSEYDAALKLVSRERYSDAAQKLEAALAVQGDAAVLLRARFLAGYCRYKSGSWGEAAKHFEEYIKANGLLTDYARYHRALALTRAMDTDTAPGAWKLFFTNHPNTRWSFEARINYSEALLMAGQPTAALEQLKALLAKTKSSDQRARILYLTGRCYESKKAYTEAVKTYRSVYIYHPGSGFAAECAKRLEALKKDPDSLSQVERIARAEQLYEKARFEKAFVEFGKLLADGNFDKNSEQGRKASIRYAMCLYRLYRTEEALAAFRAIIADMPTGAYTSTAQYYSAHCLGRLERYDEALEAYRTVAEKFPQSSLAPNAYSNIAQILVERGKWDEAVENLGILRRKYAKSAKEFDVSWKIGWIEYRRGRFENARSAFMDHPGGRELTERRNDYWSARSLERMGKPDEAKTEYEALRSERAYDYYGILSAARSGSPQPMPMQAATPEARVVELSASSIYLDRARELALMGLTDFAGEELAELQAKPGLTQEDQYAIALMLEQYGDFYHSRQAAYKYMKVDLWNYKPENRRFWKLFYPQAYKQNVTSHCSQCGVDPNLVWSIMMQESNFKPRVVSPAGARGLMQLILPTAGSVAKRLGIADYKESDLFDPATNIRFGITYLSDVAREFGEHPARFYMAVASYNGGPQNVHRWRRARPALEFDEFVEEIPFLETRNYVKKVYGNWSVYQMLYGKGTQAGIVVPVGVPMIVQTQAGNP